MNADEREIAASVLWALKGDAGQRAIAAWHMGWEPALEVAGRDWLAPFLAELLDDPYAAIRQVTQKSLHTLPGFEQFDFYPGYSANFFDDDHFVMKGGSPRTAAKMLRRSFRNWFRKEYKYMYATFRLVKE